MIRFVGGRCAALLVLASVLLLTPHRAGATASAAFTGVGDLPGGATVSRLSAVSADGRVAVGVSSRTGGVEAVRWQDGKLIGLGKLNTDSSYIGEATAVSADGRVIAGLSRSDLASAGEAFVWTAETEMVGLGDLPGGDYRSQAFGISGDGLTVVGKGLPDVVGSPGEGFRWQSGTGMVALGDLPGGIYNSRAVAASYDGNVIVGFSKYAGGIATVEWIAGATQPTALPKLPGGFPLAEPRGISLDGRVYVGFSDSSNADPGENFTEACRWVDGVPEGLGDLPGGAFDGRALATNADGSVVVGMSDTGLEKSEAFLWTERDGVMRSLQSVLENDYGLDLTGWQLVEARGVSADGRTIVGYGTNPDGDTEGFVAHIPTVARMWNEALLDAIRVDYPAPTVHSRNLFHLSAAMWDSWAAYDPESQGYYSDESEAAEDVTEARREAISYAAYRILSHRFDAAKSSPTAAIEAPAAFDALMDQLGYDKNFVATEGGVNPAAELGNRVAAAIIAHGSGDGANEDDPTEAYRDLSYEPINPIMNVDLPGATQPILVGEDPEPLVDPNRWQPLALEFLVLQNGIVVGDAIQVFLGSRWGQVTPFALTRESEEDVYADPGPPPFLGCPGDILPCAGDTEFKQAITSVIRFSSRVDPDDGAMMDASPGAIGNNPLGTQDGTGFETNPFTGEPYAPNPVLRADYGRVLAEFWADGPDSETPPGHWNTLAGYVTDHPALEKRIGGEGPIVDDLEWDVKLYFALNGAVFDAAIAAWDAKRKYDYVRPITQIRYMGGQGQSTDPMGASYHPHGLPLVPGLIEVVTEETAAPGGRHEFVPNYELQERQEGELLIFEVVEIEDPPIGQVAIYTWPGQPGDPEAEYSGVRWTRAVDWLPYQRETFVTPPFAGYTSGHSTFSRAAAEVLTEITGSPYFPAGLGTFTAPADTFLEFEIGPTEDVVLQWATYYDAADEAGISRLWGGIHVPADDFAGRIMGSQIGEDAWSLAASHFAVPEPTTCAQAFAALLTLASLRRRRERPAARSRGCLQ